MYKEIIMLGQLTTAELLRVAEALTFTKNAHEGQLYGNVPYWQHPVEVAGTIENPTVDEFIAALFHDVVEDTSWSLRDLAVTYPAEVVAMVELLTKDETMSYQENIQRIVDSGNVGAMKVKLADNRVNNSGDKSSMSEARRNRLNAQYAMSIDMLEAALA